MPSYHVISRERHARKCWQRHSTYAFAAADAFVPLSAVELAKAVLTLPTALIKQGEGFILVAVLGLQSGVNLFVAPDGRWIGNYIPAALRSYPFHLVQTEDGEKVLCIDEDGGLVSDGPAGEHFFADDGQPVQAVLDVLNFLDQIELSRLRTQTACAALQKHDLIQPWPVIWKTEAGDKQLTGLFRIDEAALNALPGEALVELRQAGALMVAYCHLLSMQHLPLLGQMADAQAKAAIQALAARKAASNASADLPFLDWGGTISLAGLR